ncbi:MAG: ATP synthase F1 subunit epsilon [Planctomycetes bacterium]|nr:ATP synthase F1 subunit epsilon [Planctomycetota bacterium]
MTTHEHLHATILSVEASVFDGTVNAVYARSSDGDFEIQQDHDTLAAVLSIAPLALVLPNGSRMEFAVHGGILQVHNNRVLVLADALESAGDIDSSRAKSALDRASERLSRPPSGDVDLDRAEAARERALLRLLLSSRH